MMKVRNKIIHVMIIVIFVITVSSFTTISPKASLISNKHESSSSLVISSRLKVESIAENDSDIDTPEDYQGFSQSTKLLRF